MANEIIKEMLQNRYHAVAYTDKYIMVYTYKKVVYMTVCDSHMVDRVTCLDRASRGQGYALRFKPNGEQKRLLMSHNCEVICSEEYFNDMVLTTKYNRGEIAEKLVTEYYGQAWEKDNIPFTQAGDIEINGIAYQIKFEKATFTNEKAIANLG